MSNSSDNPITQYNLRWSDELKEKVVEASKNSSRSINQEIVARLEQSFSFVEEKSAANKKIDVCLQVLSSLDFELEEDEYQNLILQFDPAQVPVKGDFLQIESMDGGIRTFEVTKRIVNTTTNSYVSFILELQSPIDWE
ncbi:Arc family DNA-binding protein [Acinetobacter bereziniae]|uniref:Arc family DNA-binding protein n=1 Tax=Acinetobacter bereziniae TaxID=106648 RepID=UPI0019016A24|nr:Arc family DNA-binding protein [Acinetobacter bereziniae]MBJ9904807.1 Arc family DNA-binding protein [Acinetobacter bereziniae]MCU4317890.1 Arc family DNA-binding protein [Acinetobacter bereziniae]MCU4600159.1 Arc family DNA-binding protein [Acinetobacter bereziniae]